MIVSRTPLRISFLGGGTDFRDFYQSGFGQVISCTINRYIYISLNKITDFQGSVLKYAILERVDDINKISHPIIKQVMLEQKLDQIDLSVSSDIPAGTGLGSSSAFTVGLLHGFHTYSNKSTSKMELAKEACRIEIEELGQPIGKQDAYACANGGLNVIKFSADEAVDVSPIRISLQDRLNLENSMVLIRVGNTRSASNMLSRANSNKISQLSNIKLLGEMLDLVKTFEESFGTDLVRLGNALTESWALKKAVFPQASNEEIDDVVMRGLRAGALGAKLLGAGGSGFVLFLVPPDLRSMFLEHFPGRNNQTVSIESSGTSALDLSQNFGHFG